MNEYGSEEIFGFFHTIFAVKIWYEEKFLGLGSVDRLPSPATRGGMVLIILCPVSLLARSSGALGRCETATVS